MASRTVIVRFVAFPAARSGALLSSLSGKERTNMSWNYSKSEQRTRILSIKYHTPNVLFSMALSSTGLSGIRRLVAEEMESKMIFFQETRKSTRASTMNAFGCLACILLGLS